MLYQQLIDFYSQKYITAQDQAGEVRLILENATWDGAKERVDALAQSNGDPVVRRGSREWHYAYPSHPAKVFRPGSHYPALERGLTSYAVVAADGSQIFPDPRSPYPFAIVRIVTLSAIYGSGERPIARPVIITPDDDQLLAILLDNLQPAERNAAIGGLRGRMELAIAADSAKFPYAAGPKVVLVDGPLHLYEPENETAIRNHAQALNACLAAGAIPVGVIEGGDARYTVRLAGLLANVESDKDWPDVTDYHVWSTLDDGERSPLFSIASGYNFSPFSVPVSFFYTKVGETVMRVEIPSGLSGEQARQAEQVVQAESKGLEYPYSLLKVHELAVLRGAERAAYIDQYETELGRYGLRSRLSRKLDLKGLV